MLNVVADNYIFLSAFQWTVLSAPSLELALRYTLVSSEGSESLISFFISLINLQLIRHLSTSFHLYTFVIQYRLTISSSFSSYLR